MKSSAGSQRKNDFVLPQEVTRKRVFWVLASVFALLVLLAILLFILLLNIMAPQGFGAAPRTPVANFLKSFYGPANSLISRPSGLAVSPSGEVYVSDTGNSRVAVFNQEGELVRSITTFVEAEAEQDGGAGTNAAGESVQTGRGTKGKPTSFQAPASLAFASDGRWFAVDAVASALLFFDSGDYFLQGMTFAQEAPISVKVNRDASGNEYLFVTSKSGVMKGNLEGVFERAYMNWGQEEGQFDNPSATVVYNPESATGSLTIVCDVLNYRVQAFKNFDSAPEVVWSYGNLGDKRDGTDTMGVKGATLSLPVDLALSGEGRLFILDGLASEIVVLNAQTGEFEYTISDAGSLDGLLYYPSALAYRDGRIYVADKFNDRVSIFEDAPPTPQEVSAAAGGLNRWWLLLPPLLALLLILGRLLTLRTPRYVLDLSFIESLSEDSELQRFVIENFDTMTVAVGIEAAAEAAIPGFDWKVETFDERKVAALFDEQKGLSENDAEALVVTAAKKNRSFLLTASRAVEKVAENQGMKTLRFADFRSLAYAILEAQRWEDAAGVQRLEDATDEQRLEDAEDELIVEDDV